MTKGLIGKIMSDTSTNSKIWKEVMDIVNMPEKEKKAFHRKVALQMQQDLDRDTLEYVKVWVKKTENKGKNKFKRTSRLYKMKIRETDTGDKLMFVRGKTTARIRVHGKMRVYNLMKEEDGYEWLKFQKEIIEEDVNNIPW